MGKIEGDGPTKMKELAVKLKTADPALKRDLRRALRDAAGGAADAARASIMSMPGTKVGTPPLRASVAASVTVRVGLASTIQVDVIAEPNKMPHGMGSMPGHLDQETFNHPVFARGPRAKWTWREQRGKRGWFENSISGTQPDAERKINDAMDATAAYIAGSP